MLPLLKSHPPNIKPYLLTTYSVPDGPADLGSLSMMIGNWVFYDEKNGANENARNVPIKSETSA